MSLQDALSEFNVEKNEDILDAAFKSDEIQMVAKENFRDPGKVIFVMENGKVGFPTRNSIPVEIGDIVRGRIHEDSDTYFLFEVQKIVSDM